MLRSGRVFVELKSHDVSLLDQLSAESKSLIHTFFTESGHRLVPTGELVVKPKPHVNIRSMLQTKYKDLQVIKEDKYGILIIEVPDLTQLVGYSQ